MAYKNCRGGSRKTTRKTGGRKSKYTQLERLAYNMGKVQDAASRDTRVAESYAAGKASNSKATNAKKPLY